MTVVKMKLSALRRPERNVRMHTEKQLVELERSVTMFGQIRPIAVDDALTILAGNGLYEALLRMGWKEADVLKVEGLSENQKKKLMLADNRIYGLGVDDLESFDVFLEELKDDLDIPGFDEDLLRSMVSQAGEIDEKLQGYGSLDENEIQAIRAAGERKNRLMSTGVPQNDAGEEETESAEADEEREPIRSFVICPHCGEKVWL